MDEQTTLTLESISRLKIKFLIYSIKERRQESLVGTFPSFHPHPVHLQSEIYIDGGRWVSTHICPLVSHPHLGLELGHWQIHSLLPHLYLLLPQTRVTLHTCRTHFLFPGQATRTAVDNKERNIVNVRSRSHVHFLLNVVLLHNNLI